MRRLQTNPSGAARWVLKAPTSIVRVIPVDEQRRILLHSYSSLLGRKIKLVPFTQVSNALGTITPAREMVAGAHRAGARVVDSAEAVAHLRVDVQALDVVWYVFSGHNRVRPNRGPGALRQGGSTQ